MLSYFKDVSLNIVINRKNNWCNYCHGSKYKKMPGQCYQRLLFSKTRFSSILCSTAKYSWPDLDAAIAVGCGAIATVVVLKGLGPNQLDKKNILTACKVLEYIFAISKH